MCPYGVARLNAALCGAVRRDAARGVARYRARGVVAAASGSAAMVEGVEQVPSQDKLDPCCSPRRGDEPSRRVVGRG